MRILIAGATGPIGRALVRRLRAKQHEVAAWEQPVLFVSEMRATFKSLRQHTR